MSITENETPLTLNQLYINCFERLQKSFTIKQDRTLDQLFYKLELMGESMFITSAVTDNQTLTETGSLQSSSPPRAHIEARPVFLHRPCKLPESKEKN